MIIFSILSTKVMLLTKIFPLFGWNVIFLFSFFFFFQFFFFQWINKILITTTISTRDYLLGKWKYWTFMNWQTFILVFLKSLNHFLFLFLYFHLFIFFLWRFLLDTSIKKMIQWSTLPFYFFSFWRFLISQIIKVVLFVLSRVFPHCPRIHQ